MRFYHFKVTSWEDTNHATESGIVVGNNYADAMETMQNYYGSEDMIKCELTAIDDCENGIIVMESTSGYTTELPDFSICEG
jgi:hypothetical protein